MLITYYKIIIEFKIYFMPKNIVYSLYKNMLFQISYFAPYVPTMQIIKNDCTIKCTNIQDDTFNMVMDTHFTLENANQKIDEIVNLFQDKHLPFSWWVGPTDSPSDLKERLILKNFISKEDDYGMYLDLENYTSSLPSKLKIKQVSNATELKEFDNVHVHSFGNPKAFDIIFNKIPPSAYQEKSPYRFYTGYFNKKAVTTGVLIFHANVVGIYYIVTLPEERRKGYATEMMNHLLTIAKEENQKIAVLQASESGKKVYKKMDFKECCIFQEFIKTDA